MTSQGLDVQKPPPQSNGYCCCYWVNLLSSQTNVVSTALEDAGWLFSSPVPPTPGGLRGGRAASCSTQSSPQTGQAEGGLKSRGRKEVSTLGRCGAQMSLRVTTAFPHCE